MPRRFRHFAGLLLPIVLVACTSLESGGASNAHDGGDEDGGRDASARSDAQVEDPNDGATQGDAGPDACAGDGCDHEPVCEPRSKLDVLLVLDASLSMEARRLALAGQLQDFMRALLSGDMDGDGASEHAGFASVQLGIVTSDLGAGSPDFAYRVPTCDIPGEDGHLLSAGDVSQLGCAEQYAPPFITAAAASGSVDVAARDLECILRAMPSDGCGFEHPLEAALKALSTTRNPWRFTWGEPHGDAANDGFVRDDAMLAVIVMSDEDDCSQLDLDLARTDSVRFGDVGMNMRCAALPEALTPLARYAHGLTGLKERPGDVFFGAIAGVPEDLVEERGAGVYKRALEDSRMAITPSGDLESPATYPENACERDGQGAMPARRLLQLADTFGERGFIQSLCAASLRTTLRRFADAIGQANADADCATDACPCEAPFVCDEGRCTCDAAITCHDACDALADGCGGAHYCGGCPGTLQCSAEEASVCANTSECAEGHVCATFFANVLVPTHAAIWLLPSADEPPVIPDLSMRSELGFGTVTGADGMYEVDIDLSTAGLSESSKGYLAIIAANHDLAVDGARPGDQWFLNGQELSFGDGWTVSLAGGVLSLLPLTPDDAVTPGDEREGVVACAEPCATQCCGGETCGYDVCESYVVGCDGAEDCIYAGDVCCAQTDYASCLPKESCTAIACHDTGDCEAPKLCLPNAASPNLPTCQ